MTESLVANRVQSSGAYALELDGVARHFGALVALSGINMRIAAGERRAVLGSNGAGKTTLFNAVSGDFMPTSGRIRFFGEDITDLPPHERIRRGLRRTYQISQLFKGLSVLDSIFLACRGVSRRRFSLLRPAISDVNMVQTESILNAVHLEAYRDTLVATLSHGQQRQLEIALALAGAPRFILFDEPAAGLSPTERRDLVAILNALPKHIGYIIIEHDLDVALRVSEYVSMMHNGRLFKEGTPREIEADPEVQEIYLGGKHG
ncbi:ABC transporter ATP-binding protein [Mesorhizobium sp. B2-3-14]|uniref:ABC transporter ATP-binding protein n=1 Tax=unclassified Mesorhizobium TaxID=325217 RepID=UPI0011261634|nr:MULTISPECIES: ABC transporter ATP-binding protein [unclassified Mesorhizobium]TPK72325.1 ABC transporter ATP-binding protein [Mesorhizobium sp. B2-4-18]TPL79654.1 ABC transporter ATP-binding protein [Mesorhizobium sp. B2-3-14]